VNEAALLAARRGRNQIEPRLLSEAVERVVAGPEKRSRILSAEDRARIAYHECGHAVVSTALPGTDRVSKLSIVARGHAGGFTWMVPEGDQVVITRSQLLDRIAALLGGRAAERVVFGEVSSGAQADLEHAVQLGRRMIADFGMSQHLGPYIVKPLTHGYAGDYGVGYSERIASEIDAEVQSILKKAEERATHAIVSNRDAFERLARTLIEAETLEDDALDQLLLPISESGSIEPAAVTSRSN
ncbi:MAG: ATP-dependent zinc metalloprotease FtsH, partial [Acidimicrobiales bacterium]